MGLTGQYHDVKDDILRVDYLPPLSVTATRLLEAIADPDVEVRRLAGIIEQDPPLTGRILGMANSAFFGQSRPVLSVEEAIIRVLGLNMVKSLALSIALVGSFDTRGCPGFRLRDYWLAALGTAALAQAVARRLPGDPTRPVETLYLAGLLHNLGVLVLVHLRPAEMATVFDQLAADAEAPVGPLEEQYVGVDRWRAGEWLAFRWHLPETLVHTLGHMRNPAYEGPHAPVVELVRSARSWTEAMIAGAPIDFQVPAVAPEVAASAAVEIAAAWEELRAMSANLT
jgi:HD-like signal output (HDOD) protein